MDYTLKPGAKTAIGGAVPKGKQYTNEDIQALISEGYINVHRSLWDRIPAGSHIRYVNKGPGDMTTRFKPGGFVANHFIKDDKTFLRIETRKGGKVGQPGYISFSIAFENVETIWKKYDASNFIEIHLIYTSLAQKKKQIAELETRTVALEKQIKTLVQIINTRNEA